MADKHFHEIGYYEAITEMSMDVAIGRMITDVAMAKHAGHTCLVGDFRGYGGIADLYMARIIIVLDSAGWKTVAVSEKKNNGAFIVYMAREQEPLLLVGGILMKQGSLQVTTKGFEGFCKDCGGDPVTRCDLACPAMRNPSAPSTGPTLPSCSSLP